MAQGPNRAHCLFLQINFYWNTAIHLCIVCGYFPAPRAEWEVATETVQPAKLRILTLQPFREKGHALVSCGCLPCSSPPLTGSQWGSIPGLSLGISGSRTPSPQSSWPHCLDNGNTRDVRWASPQRDMAWDLCPKGTMWPHWTNQIQSLWESEGGSWEQEAEAKRYKDGTKTLRSAEPCSESTKSTGDKVPAIPQAWSGGFP